MRKIIRCSQEWIMLSWKANVACFMAGIIVISLVVSMEVAAIVVLAMVCAAVIAGAFGVAEHIGKKADSMELAKVFFHIALFGNLFASTHLFFLDSLLSSMITLTIFLVLLAMYLTAGIRGVRAYVDECPI